MRSHQVDYLAGYSADLRSQASNLRAGGELQRRLAARYPDRHDVTTNAALYTYVQDLKRTYMRSAPPLGKVRFDDQISTLHRAFGLHTYAVRVQGSKLKRKHEVHIASVFKTLPAAFLRMLCVHELAHLKQRDHNKAFYALCEHMEPDYHRLELDLRLWLFAAEAKKGVPA